MDYRQLKALICESKLSIAELFNHIQTFTIEQFEHNPNEIYRIMRKQTLLVDQLLKVNFPHHNNIAIIATGGYGRGERTPYSDLDLLILSSHDDDDTNTILTSYTHLLHSLPTKVGYSTHTIESALTTAQQDSIFLTTLIDMRYIVGNYGLYKQFEHHFRARTNLLPPDQFIEIKLNEQRSRSSTYPLNQQPNIKHMIGGLRDLHTIHWMLSYTFNRTDLEYFLSEGYLTQTELDAFMQGHRFLSQVRFHLHILNRRHDDVLKLQDQDVIADKMGYRHPRLNKKIERFMRELYAVAYSIRFFNQVAIAALLDHTTQTTSTEYNHLFNQRRRTLVAKKQTFPSHIDDLLVPFVTLSQQNELRYLDAGLCRNIRELVIKTPYKHIYNHSKLHQAFLDILHAEQHLERILTLMVDLGVLEALIPEFKRTRGQMQFDLYHQYTVDRHTLKVVENLLSLRNGTFSSGIPFVMSLAKNSVQYQYIIFAALYHDIGKGTGVDHSRYGARIAYKDAIRFGMSEDAAKLIGWLVKEHLLCSRVIKRQDISDPEVIKAFVAHIPDQSYLDALFLLTIADINGTNQKLWTPWQAMMFEQLYRAAQHQLNQKVTPNSEQQRKAIISSIEAHRSSALPSAINALWDKLPHRYFLKQRFSHLLWQTEQLSKHLQQEHLICLPYFDEEIRQSHIFIFGHSVTNPMCYITQQLFEFNLNITEANLYQPTPQFFIQKYMVTDTAHTPISNLTLLEKTASQLQKNLAIHLNSYQHKPRRVMPSQLSQRIRNQVMFLTPENKEASIIVKTIDRAGLLAQLCHFFESQQLAISQARIRTFNGRVEDHFVLLNKNISEMRKKIIRHRLLKLLEQA